MSTKKVKNTRYLYDAETPAGMVSVSQLQTYAACPKKWSYNYIENLTPRIERPFLTIGKLCHKGMQIAMQHMWANQQLETPIPLEDAWYLAMEKGVDTVAEEYDGYLESVPYLPEELPEFEQTYNDAVNVFRQAFEEFEPWKYEVLSVYKDGQPVPALELHFCIPCTASKGMHGYIDAILRDRETGHIWCTDYKFRKSLSPDDEEITNIQNAVYTRACMKMGLRITGTMTWQHSNTPAAEPALNKNGTVSRAKIRTTWDKYFGFCVEHNIDPEPYREEMQEKLADIEWFRATYEVRNEKFVDNVWEQVVVPLARAVRSEYKKPKHSRYMYPWNCFHTCQYKDLCQAELREHDADFLRESEYTKRDR